MASEAALNHYAGLADTIETELKLEYQDLSAMAAQIDSTASAAQEDGLGSLEFSISQISHYVLQARHNIHAALTQVSLVRMEISRERGRPPA